MDHQQQLALRRRHFLTGSGIALGAAALATLQGTRATAVEPGPSLPSATGPVPTAKRVIYIFQAGGPSQLELFDHKPELAHYHGQELPPAVFGQQRLTGFTLGQGKFPVVASPFKFAQHGESGAWFSELLPRLSQVADELCFIKSMHTPAINHDPAVTMMLTGAQQAGRPSIGSWLGYGMGSENENLPAFVVLLTPGSIQDASTPLSARHWGSGFLPARYQGVPFRSRRDAVLHLSNPPGIDAATRRDMLDVAAQLNLRQEQKYQDPETRDRIAQYEMAFRMQTSVPGLMDLQREPEHVFRMYGNAARRPGSFAANCLLARRLVESGVRFVQVFDRDWDHHRNAPRHLRTKTSESDQPLAALVQDLKARGLLEDTLVICGGEFGRTVYSQGPFHKKYGRDHHGGCFTMWLAGGGIKPGVSYGATDEFGFNVAESPVAIHDLQATMLHCLGMDHRRLTFKFQSREHRLTDVGGRVIAGVLTDVAEDAESQRTRRGEREQGRVG